MIFQSSLSDSKSPQVSRTLLSILVDLNNAVVCMVSARPLISKSFSPCTKLLVTVPNATITIPITVTFMFHIFFSSLARSWYSSFFSLSFGFILWSAGMAKSTIRQVLFIIIIIVIVDPSFQQAVIEFFYSNPSDSKSPQLSRTFLIILADLNNAAI